MTSKYLTREEAAKVIRVTTKSLDNWAKDGTGPPRIKANRRVLYDAEKLEEWLHEREQQPA